MSEQPLSALFMAVTKWGLDHGHTGDGKSVVRFDGPDNMRVRLYASPNELEGIPPYALVIENDGLLPVAMCNPYSGVVMQLGEDKLIELFSQPTHPSDEGGRHKGIQSRGFQKHPSLKRTIGGKVVERN